MGLTALSTSIVIAQLGQSPACQIYRGPPVSHRIYRRHSRPGSAVYGEHTLSCRTDARRTPARTENSPSMGHRSPQQCSGSLFFALLAVRTGALRPEFVVAMTHIGVEAAGVSTSHVFWSGVIGGWIIALVAWLVSGSHSITGSVMLIWLLTFVVGLGGFAHCIATSGEILSAVLDHQIAISGILPGSLRQRWATSAAACCWSRYWSMAR